MDGYYQEKSVNASVGRRFRCHTDRTYLRPGPELVKADAGSSLVFMLDNVDKGVRQFSKAHRMASLPHARGPGLHDPS